MRITQEVIRTNATPYTILGQYFTADLLVVNKFIVDSRSYQCQWIVIHNCCVGSGLINETPILAT